MSAVEHFKAAASALANARQEKQREIDDLRKHLDKREIDVKHSSQELKGQIRSLERNSVMLANSETGSAAEKAHVTRSISKIQKIISASDSDFGKEKRDILDHISRLEKEMIGLDSQIRDLESRR